MSDQLKAALEEAELQRRRYRDLFETAPLPYLTTDPSGGILEANHAAVDLLGKSREELIGTPLLQYLAGASGLERRIGRLSGGRPVQPWESEIRPASGSTVPVEVSARLVDRMGDHDPEIKWVIQDLRARREARERERELHREQAARAALEQVAERARFLSDASGRLMGVLDPHRVWSMAAELAASQAVAALVVEADDDRVRVRGASGDEDARGHLEPLLDRTFDMDPGAIARSGPDVLPLRPIRVAMSGGDPEIVPAPEGPPARACVIVPIRSPERNLGAMAVWLSAEARIGEELLVARNLADRVALALESAAMFQEVVRARREAEEASTAEADFLSIVSHELRTPLTAIVSYAELLEDRAAELPQKLARYAHQIAAAADHQRQLVEQILSYRRVQREVEAVEAEALDYCKVARSAVAMVRPQVGGRDLELRAIVPSTPVRGECDRGKLQQILTNLLSNSIRHTSEGHVRLIMATDAEWVVFRVEDTGEGIAAEDLPRIFDRFWRGVRRDGDGGGSGLGLTITRELVQRLKGEIEVESEPGAGSAFTVRLPRE